jgi:hypothetical protein
MVADCIAETNRGSLATFIYLEGTAVGAWVYGLANKESEHIIVRPHSVKVKAEHVEKSVSKFVRISSGVLA